MKLYRQNRNKLVDNKKIPSDWKPGDKIYFNATIEKVKSKHTQVWLQIEEDDVIESFSALLKTRPRKPSRRMGTLTASQILPLFQALAIPIAKELKELEKLRSGLRTMCRQIETRQPNEESPEEALNALEERVTALCQTRKN